MPVVALVTGIAACAGEGCKRARAGIYNVSSGAVKVGPGLRPGLEAYSDFYLRKLCSKFGI